MKTLLVLFIAMAFIASSMSTGLIEREIENTENEFQVKEISKGEWEFFFKNIFNDKFESSKNR